MKIYPHIRVDIFEHTMYPVVSHIFYGKSMKEAQRYFGAHMKTDAFLRGAVKDGYWNDIQLQVKITKHDGD